MNWIHLSLEHPILFLMDYGNDSIQVPEYSEASPIACTPSCVSVRVQPDIDGGVEVCLSYVSDLERPTEMELVFDSLVETPSRAIAVVNSNDVALVNLETAGQVTNAQIWVDSVTWPSRVLIALKASASDCFRTSDRT